jgi:hypothetical protein
LVIGPWYFAFRFSRFAFFFSLLSVNSAQISLGFVIPTEAARFSLPRRILARRAA